MRVAVYRNLNREKQGKPDCWSIAEVSSTGGSIRKVFKKYGESILLTNCVAHVVESGRQRVLRDKRRAVHAWIVGDLVGVDGPDRTGERVTYNPYRLPTFHFADSQSPFLGCETLSFNRDGQAHKI